MGDIAKEINSTFVNAKVKALINIKYTANWINSYESDFFRGFGLSSQQYNILRILKGAGDATKVQVVKERMIERAPNATRLMDKLLVKKLIDRTRCDNDRRVVYVSITPKGVKLLEEIDKDFKLDFLNNITEEEATILSDLLDKLR